MQEVKFDREDIVEKLKSRICQVTFIKKDGTTRVMNCTLNSSMIPQVKLEEDRVRRTKTENPDVLAVYDVESFGWRSFKWDSLLNFRDGMNL